MNLLQLCTALGARIGLQPGDERDYSKLATLVNQAAQEIWQATDLPNSLAEQVFESSDAAPLRVTLPQTVGMIRGFRNNLTTIRQHDLRPRYQIKPWKQLDNYTWQITAELAINREISNSLQPTITSLGVIDSAFTVTIIGRTSTVGQQIVTLTHNVDGTITGDSANFTSIDKIYKSDVTPADVSVTADGQEIALLYSWATTARYYAVQLFTSNLVDPVTAGNVRQFECLYKPCFVPLNFDESTFQLDGYDEAIIWRAMALYWLQSTDLDKLEKLVPIYMAKSQELVSQRINDMIQTRDLVVQFGPARFDARNLRGIRRIRYGHYNV